MLLQRVDLRVGESLGSKMKATGIGFLSNFIVGITKQANFLEINVNNCVFMFFCCMSSAVAANMII